MNFRAIARATALAIASVTIAAPLSAQEEYDTSRVVIIGGSLTEIVYALGEEQRLVARDTTSVHPQAALALPDVGYIRQLSPEGVRSVDPTLILALEGSGPPDAIEVLRKASIPLVEVPDAHDRNAVLEKIRIVGEVLGVEEKAKALVEKADAELKSAEAEVEKIGKRRTVLFVLSLQGGRILASGIGTAANGIITMAGGDNVISDYEGYKQLTDEAVIAAAPDVILVMNRGGDHATRVADLLAHPAIATTPAAKEKRIISIDGSYMLGFGPRTASAISDLTTTIYGEGAAE